MYCTVISGALVGVQAYLVAVEVDIAPGLPAFTMVGSLGMEVRESRERVCVALKNIGLDIPPMHITVNLSPADRRKEGTAYDLPIAVGMLNALGYFPREAVENTLFLGELGLDGDVKKVRGVLPIIREAARQGITQCIVPRSNALEGAVIPEVTVRGVGDMKELLAFFTDSNAAEHILPRITVDGEALFGQQCGTQSYDFAQVRGQEMAKRAAEIAAAGFHNLLMVGPPGAGKSMIAKRIPGILPPLTLEESLEVTSIVSVAGLLGENQALVRERPFQSPHHTISQAAMAGGGSIPRPGIISLSHRGILFLDELPEFPRGVLDGMRQPIEEKKVLISRVGGNIAYPSDFMLVCAMNPCPCGYYPNRNRCRCTSAQVGRYMGRVSGPILDRIDLCVELQPVNIQHLTGTGGEESSEEIRKRVEAARQVQEERFRGTKYRFNGDIAVSYIDKYCYLGQREEKCMAKLYHSMELSARSYHRIRKVARTIADLAGEETIREEHLLEAACYRPTADYWTMGT